MIVDSGHWGAAAITWWVFAMVFAVVIIASVLGTVAVLMSGAKDDGEALVLLGVWWVAILIGVGSMIIGYYPFDSSYHKYYEVRGTVVDINSRILTTGDGVNQRNVVRLKESGNLYGIDDTRATILKAGDTVDLKCKKEWQYQGADGWVCQYNQER